MRSTIYDAKKVCSVCVLAHVFTKEITYLIEYLECYLAISHIICDEYFEGIVRICFPRVFETSETNKQNCGTYGRGGKPHENVMSDIWRMALPVHWTISASHFDMCIREIVHINVVIYNMLKTCARLRKKNAVLGLKRKYTIENNNSEIIALFFRSFTSAL